MKPKLRFLLVAASMLATLVIGLSWSPASRGEPTPQDKPDQDRVPTNRVLAHALDVELGRVQRQKYEQGVSSGTLYALLSATGVLDERASSVPDESATNVPDLAPSLPSTASTQACSNTYSAVGFPNNVRVNQDCSRRRQAEEVIAINPRDSANLIVGANDSRIGFNHGSYAWSFDGGTTWGDQIPPFWQFQLLDGHTADAFSDPTATFDADANAYVGGIIFDVAANANAVVVAKSNAGIGGAFYHTPAALSFQTYRNTPLGVVANDNNPNIFHDKEFIVADATPSSPKKNNVYATWTRFNASTGAGVGGNSPIDFSQSTDGGATWSARIEISGANPAKCTIFSGSANPNACDQDQGSHPIVGSDGTIYVAFFNGNTPLVGVNQHLLVRCPKIGSPVAGTDCSNVANWSAPTLITNDIDNQPIGPNATTGCPAGRACLPPNGYRVPDETYGSLSVDSSGKLYHVFSDFRYGGGTCTGRAATATPPCNQDVFYSYSTDGGATWSAIVDVTPHDLFGQTAQWQPWSAVVAGGSKLWIAYYDRSYGSCETTGCNDITLVAVSSPASISPSLTYTRLTTSSMPNLVVANNPLQAGFLGDYMWVATDATGRAHVVWADTRGLHGTVEEDIYYATVP